MTSPVGEIVLSPRSAAAWLAGVAIFMIFCTPSMKIFVYTEGLNVIPPILLAAGALISPGRSLSRSKLATLCLAGAFFSVLLAFGLYDSSSLDYVTLAKYTNLLLLCALLPLAADRKAMAVAVILIAAWGVALSIFQLRYGIQLDPSRGQHYLTVGYALGSATLIGLTLVFTGRLWTARIAGMALFFVCMTAAATLLGRGPVIFPVLAFLTYYLANSVVAAGPGKLLARTMFIAILALTFTYALHQTNLAANLEDRISRLATIRDEPRMTETYLPAIEAIMDQPLGFGLEAHDRLIGFYPHNIFLEILLSSGVTGFVLFAVLVTMFLRHLPLIARNGSDVFVRCLFLLTLYYFFIWNVSFDLASAYAVVPMVVLFASVKSRELRENSGQDPGAATGLRILAHERGAPER